jgi:hypothetical protein
MDNSLTVVTKIYEDGESMAGSVEDTAEELDEGVRRGSGDPPHKS